MVFTALNPITTARRVPEITTLSISFVTSWREKRAIQSVKSTISNRLTLQSKKWRIKQGRKLKPGRGRGTGLGGVVGKRGRSMWWRKQKRRDDWEHRRGTEEANC